MAKSFCTGCKYREWYNSYGFGYPRGFFYCDKFKMADLSDRKRLCNGKYKENKV